MDAGMGPIVGCSWKFEDASPPMVASSYWIKPMAIAGIWIVAIIAAAVMGSDGDYAAAVLMLAIGGLATWAHMLQARLRKIIETHSNIADQEPR